MKIRNSWILLLLCTASTGVTQKLPDDLDVEETVAEASYQTPVGSAFAADGQLFAAEKQGRILIVVDSASAPNGPMISSISPVTGPVGAEIEVRGSNLAEVIQLLFNGTPANEFKPHHDHVRVRIPFGATSGEITVITFDGSAVSSDVFIVEADHLAPAVGRFEPLSGVSGTTVTVWGKHFAATNEVRFNGILTASFLVESDTLLVAKAPFGVTTGKLTVSSESGMGMSDLDFVVLSGETRLLTFHPTDDAYAWSKKPGSHRGQGVELRIRKSSERQQAYLKFDVSGVNSRVLGAVLYLYARDGSDDGGYVYRVQNEYSDNSGPWSENGLSWNNAPAIRGVPVDRVRDVLDDNIVQFDLGTAIRGNGVVSFAIKNESSNLVSYDAKEGANPPALVIRMERDPLSSSEPIIAGFMPVSGLVGTQVTVFGRNIGKTSEIRFGAQLAPKFSVDSDTTVFVEVPVGAVTGKIRLTNSGGLIVSPLPFEVELLSVEPPVVTGIKPASGK
ncbi:DNRLRE domain-containing protein, partial [bacterium]|nr:DNRLRE domain-containing protein [bacterium]